MDISVKNVQKKRGMFEHDWRGRGVTTQRRVQFWVTGQKVVKHWLTTSFHFIFANRHQNALSISTCCLASIHYRKKIDAISP